MRRSLRSWVPIHLGLPRLSGKVVVLLGVSCQTTTSSLIAISSTKVPTGIHAGPSRDNGRHPASPAAPGSPGPSNLGPHLLTGPLTPWALGSPCTPKWRHPLPERPERRKPTPSVSAWVTSRFGQPLSAPRPIEAVHRSRGGDSAQLCTSDNPRLAQSQREAPNDASGRNKEGGGK